MRILCRHLADYVKKLHQKACCTCSTIIFSHSTNQIIIILKPSNDNGHRKTTPNPYDYNKKNNKVKEKNQWVSCQVTGCTHWSLKKKRQDRTSIVQKVKPRKVSGSHFVGTTLKPYRTCQHWEENHLDATRKRHVIPRNSEEGTFFLKRFFFFIAFSKLYRESDSTEMAPLASNWEREQQAARSSISFEISRWTRKWTVT